MSGTTWQSGPARQPDCAILTCDSGHLPQAVVVARRIAAVEPEGRFDIVIATPDTDSIPRAALDGRIRFTGLDVSAIPQIRHPISRIGLGTFYRHLLPRAFVGEYRAMFYLDTDTWLRRPGLQGLFDRMPDDLAIAAAPDFEYQPTLEEAAQVVDPSSRARQAALSGPNGEVWQSGALLIGVQPYLDSEADRRVLSWAGANEAVLHAHRIGEQGVLNKVCGGEIRMLDPRWNWQKRRFLREEMVARFDPWLLHFCGRDKPWLIGDDPYVATFNAAWWEGLRALDPGFAPHARPGSLAALTRTPRFGLPPLDALHRWRKSRREARREEAARPGPAAAVAMQALIDRAEVA
ncbi:glycosyltransferase family 8 protein [Wenxinia saemankumensis]|uniref:Lipopolysaccharide biosynthesis protein, LPS:glycosyltransferase n=1 Tax=Wenxinia saemankumensis TaxID=1447782 RepID=A0A1M6G3X2_9RHOB|nr:glycosyltransferase [Wenxinia saemankumensis]SHJ04517.1 Lipopolysaccharide biosynthesis protein, LPS:glycosyltransferase [Wenxinia saemankumensis]